MLVGHRKGHLLGRDIGIPAAEAELRGICWNINERLPQGL